MAKVFGVCSTQKSALMMIKPPGEIRVRCILEIDDDVEISIKKAVFKQLVGTVRKTRVFEAGLRDRNGSSRSALCKLLMPPHQSSGHDRGLAPSSKMYDLRKTF